MSDPYPLSDSENQAFENFFHDCVLKQGLKPAGLCDWGPQYWERWGVTVEDSQIKFKTPAHRTWFLLKWG